MHVEEDEPLASLFTITSRQNTNKNERHIRDNIKNKRPYQYYNAKLETSCYTIRDQDTITSSQHQYIRDKTWKTKLSGIKFLSSKTNNAFSFVSYLPLLLVHLQKHKKKKYRDWTWVISLQETINIRLQA